MTFDPVRTAEVNNRTPPHRFLQVHTSSRSSLLDLLSSASIAIPVLFAPPGKRPVVCSCRLHFSRSSSSFLTSKYASASFRMQKSVKSASNTNEPQDTRAAGAAGARALDARHDRVSHNRRGAILSPEERSPTFFHSTRRDALRTRSPGAQFPRLSSCVSIEVIIGYDDDGHYALMRDYERNGPGRDTKLD